MNLTIRAKLLLLFFALAAVPMLVVGAAGYYNSVRSVESVVEQRSANLVEEIAGELILFFEDRSSEVRLLARNQPVQKLYARIGSGDLEHLDRIDPGMERFFSDFFAGPREVYARTVYLDLEGEPILGYSRDGETALLAEQYSFSFGETVIPSLELAAYRGRDGLFASSHFDSTFGSALRLGQWVRDNHSGAAAGFLVADLQLDRLLSDTELTERAGRDAQLIIVSRRDERVVHHPQRHLLGTSLAESDAGLAQLYGLARHGSGQVWYGEGESRRMAAYANLEQLDWTVFILNDPRALTAPARRTALFNLGIAVGALALILILVPLVLGRITASIRQVTAGAEAIASGDLEQEIAVSTHDETRQLADSFNRMSRSLKTTMGDLRQLTEELEERVRSRTSELEAANEQIQQVNVQLQEASSHKSDFLARMSHDLRTPMNAIIGYTRILLRRTKEVLDDRQYQNLENIQTSAGNLLALINDILDLTKIEAGRMDVKLEEVDVRQLVEDCARSIETLLKPGVSLVRNLDGAAPLKTDPDRLRSVVMNLLSNAVKFTEAGTITVTLQDADGGQRLSVADTGVGISAEDLPRVFEEFHQLEQRPGQQQGSGLGLAIAQKTVELLGGTISLESELGRGTTFTVELPR